MSRDLRDCILLAILVVAFGLVQLWIARVATAVNVGDGGSTLPACTASLVGSRVYGVAGHDWLCVSGSPYRWVITR